MAFLFVSLQTWKDFSESCVCPTFKTIQAKSQSFFSSLLDSFAYLKINESVEEFCISCAEPTRSPFSPFFWQFSQKFSAKRNRCSTMCVMYICQLADLVARNPGVTVTHFCWVPHCLLICSSWHTCVHHSLLLPMCKTQPRITHTKLPPHLISLVADN